MLCHHVEQLTREVEGNPKVPAYAIELLGQQALELGVLTGRAKWVELALELHRAGGRVMSHGTIERLSDALGVVSGVDPALFASYLALLRRMSDDLDRRELADSAELERLEGRFEAHGATS